MDNIDLKIINLLLKNAREPLSSLAQANGISKAAIHQRIKKLEENGVIVGSKILVDVKKMGFDTMAYIGIFLEKAKLYKKVMAHLEKVPEVIECSFTTGTYSLLIKMVCHDNQHLMELLNRKIQSIDGIARTETFICLEQSFDRAIPC